MLVLILAFVGKKKGWFGKAETIKVAIEKSEYRNIVETISANGKIHPEMEVKITPDVSGEIVAMAVKEGDHVKAGTFLAKIKPDTYISAKNRVLAALNSSRARLAQVNASFTQSRLSYERNKKLWEQKTISKSEFEQAEASYKMAEADVASAKASIKSAEASLKEAEENLVKTTLYAPITGTIYGLNVEKGERVVGTALMSGTEMMRVADLNRMEVVVEVNENDIVKVRVGDTAIIEVDAYLDDQFRGVVTEIANSATTTGVSIDQVTNFNVKILLLKKSYEHLIKADNLIPFRPGMSANVDIQTNRKSHILSVPIQAVTTRSDTLENNIENSGQENEVAKTAAEDTKEVVFITSEDQSIALQKEVKTGILQDKIILFALSVFSGFILVNVFVNLINPTFGWDCLNYHFTQPVEWLKHHNLINPITINDDPSPSYYPINGGLIYFWFIAPFKSAYVADLGQLPFYIISLIAVFAISKKIGLDNRLSLIAALTFGIIPNYFKELEIGYTDIMMGCLFLLTLYFIVLLSNEFKKSVFLLASISLGLLLGIKTAALPYVVFLLLCLIWLLIKHKGIKKAAVYLPVVFILMLIFGGYGFIRNTVLTGNPLYPLDFVLLGKKIFKGVRSEEHTSELQSH